MYKVACTRKEASCIVGTLLEQLRPVCEKCAKLEDEDIVLATEDGLLIKGKELTEIEGRSVLSGKLVKFEFTEYGLDFYGNPAEVRAIRRARCLYGTVNSAKEGRGLP